MPARIDRALCAKCKGVKRLCGRPVCPILKRLTESLRASSKVSRRVLPTASPPSVLVGEYGYPRVRLGPIATPVSGAAARIYEDYEKWWGKLSLEDVIALRAATVYSRFDVRVKAAGNRLLDATRELALSSTPVDAEFVFKNPPRPSLSFNGLLAPVGLSAQLSRLRIAQNPVVPRKVDQLVGDTDVKAREAVLELFRAGVSVYHVFRLLSLGMLGERSRRRIVPTRWAITAVDKTLGDALLRRVREKPEYPELEVYTSQYLGNRYLIALIPGPWSFEMIEIWLPRSVWVRGVKPYIAENYELWDGRWRKPGIDGGYYAIRFPVLEFLEKVGRQATVIAIREVTPHYYAPVGSWQIRESVRNAFKFKPVRLESLEELIATIPRYIETDVKLVLECSTLLKRLLTARTLEEYM